MNEKGIKQLQKTERNRFQSVWQELSQNWQLFAEHKMGLVGVGIIVLYGFLAFIHPILLDTVWQRDIYNPLIADDRRLPVGPNPPTWLPNEKITEPIPWYAHPLGTDTQNRDILSQLMYSSRVAFILGIVAALVTVILSTLIGAMAAYFGGWFDALVMRLSDLIGNIPSLPLLIVISFVLDSYDVSETTLVWVLAITLGLLSAFGGGTITIKAQALTIIVRNYIDAARVAGGGHWHIIMTHIVPNLMPLAFLSMMTNVLAAITFESALSYLGLINVGMSWGTMLFVAQSQGYLLNWNYWYLLLPAGLSISLLSAAFFFIGRALDDVVNPRLRKR